MFLIKLNVGRVTKKTMTDIITKEQFEIIKESVEPIVRSQYKCNENTEVFTYPVGYNRLRIGYTNDVDDVYIYELTVAKYYYGNGYNYYRFCIDKLIWDDGHDEIILNDTEVYFCCDKLNQVGPAIFKIAEHPFVNIKWPFEPFKNKMMRNMTFDVNIICNE